jgi:acyl-ACP thioesterase
MDTEDTNMNETKNGFYRRESIIAPSLCDASFALGIAQQFALVQDIAAEHAERLGVGGAAMTARGAFWLAVHTRLEFFGRAEMMQPLSVSTWPQRTAPEDLRMHRLYRIESEGKTLAEGRTEWMVLNTNTGRLLRARDAGFPTDMEFHDEQVCTAPFTRVKDDFSEAERCFSRKVSASDIDYGNHMNNVAYVRTMLDCFSSAELAALSVKSLEIRYGEPCLEGETIAMYRKKTDGGFVFAIRKPNGKTAASAILETREK